MNKEIEKYYNELVSNIDDLVYLLLITREIIEKINNEEDTIQLGLDLKYLSVTYQYDKERIYRFRKELDRIMEEYKIQVSEINPERLNELIERILNKTKK